MTAAGVAAGALLLAWTLTKPVTPAPRAPTALPTQPSGASLKSMVDAASAEGEVQVNWSGGLEEKWRQTFEAAFNREYGFKLRLLLAENAAQPRPGQPPGWDVQVGSEADAAALAHAGVLGRRDWTKLFGAPAQGVLFDGGAVAFAQQPVQPLYNTKSVPQQDIPSTWESLLEARWKGRLGVSSDAAVWADLSTAWGDGRASQFVSGLAAQQPVKGMPAELQLKLEQGAIDLLAAANGQQLHDATLRSAPVAAASVQPLLLESMVASPLPASGHPNAAALFTGFLVTEEGQQLWQDYTGQASIWYPPSATAQLVQGKQYVLAGQDFALGDRPSRTAKYAKLLGY